MAREHAWECVDSDDGILGVNTYWQCSRCHALGGVVWTTMVDGKVDHGAARGAYGAGIDLSDDCDEALAQLERHLADHPQLPLTPVEGSR